jgi:putative ABC transport system permease protein
VYAHITIWSLRRRPWRTLLTAVSVALTVAVLTAFFSVRSEIRRVLALRDAVPYQRLWLKPRNLSAERGQELPLTLKDKLAQVPGVAKVSYAVYGGTQVDGNRVTLIGYDTDAANFFPAQNPSPEVRNAWLGERTAALVSASVAKKFNLKPGMTWEIPYDKSSITMKVVGVLDPGASPGPIVVLHYEYLDEVHGRKGVVGDFYIAVDKKADYRPVVKGVDEITASYQQHLITEDTMLQMRGVKQSHVIPNLLGALGLVLLVTTALGIANSTMISVRERRAELATLRVLGVKRRTLALSVVGESLFVCLLAGLAGAALTWWAMRGGVSLNAMYLQSLTINTFGMLAGLATSLFVPLVGSALAAWLAVRAPLHVALRDVG